MSTVKEHKFKLRELCFSYKSELSSVETLQDQYNLIYDVQKRAREEFRKKLKTQDLIYEIGKIFGVSAQTIYRARAAVRAARNGTPVPRYAIRTFSNIKYPKKRSL